MLTRATVRLSGHRRGVVRLLLEADDPPLLVHLDHAEGRGLLDRDLDHPDRREGAVLLVEVEQFLVVHLVDVVPGEDHDARRLDLVQEVDVVVHRVGGALVPALAHPELGWHGVDPLPQLDREDRVPAELDVALEAAGLVLGQHEDLAEPGVEAVGEGEVDDPVHAAERHGRLAAVPGEGVEPLALAAGQDQRQRVLEDHFLPRHDTPFAASCTAEHYPSLRDASPGVLGIIAA